MLKFYIQTSEALKRLRDDHKGVVSFEYVVVAFSVVVAVLAVFGAAGPTGIQAALAGGIGAITALLPGATP